jgi:NADH dehydrogenase FAD-containing subunit
VEQTPALLGPFHPKLREYAHRQLTARGVDVMLDTTIREITADRVLLADGKPLPQLAQPALQMGRHAAAQIRRLARH